MSVLLRTLLLSILLISFPLPTLLAKKCCEKTTADYIIVGVGTAGALLAKELTDDKETSVIALHRGKNLTQDPDIKFTTNVITTVVSGLFGPPFFQTGNTPPQPYANNRELAWTIAKPEGGASSVNAGAYVRATNQVLAQWEAIAGPLWSVNRLLDVYKGLEDFHGVTNDPSAHGYNGPLYVRQNPKPSQLAQKFTQAELVATGLPYVLDYNDPNTPIGISSQVQYTQKGPHGILRVSSATAFLNRSVVTPNGIGVCGRKLRIHLNSYALRTIWEGNKAVGVEYTRCGKTKRVYARKGVIVTAGLFSSPFLLHSGVGPKSLLESLDIPVIYDNPNVGAGFADQPHIVLGYATNPTDTPLGPKTGAFSQFAMLPAPGGDPSVREMRLSTVNPFPGFTAAIFDLLQPKSRGRISISSNDPLVEPIVDLGELSNSSDFDLYVAGFQTYIKNINKALNDIDPLYQMVFPDPAILEDVNLLGNFIRDEIGSNMHFQSHCRMAPLDQGGVVDSTGHVYGVENLIVADNSVVPLCMDGAPMSSAYLIAANIALILQGL